MTTKLIDKTQGPVKQITAAELMENLDKVIKDKGADSIILLEGDGLHSFAATNLVYDSKKKAIHIY